MNKNTYRRLFSIFLSTLLIVSSNAVYLSEFSRVYAEEGTTELERKVDICHATSSETNPYNLISVPVKQIVSENGHEGHERDIIPPFEYEVCTGKGKDKTCEIVTFEGLNWDDEGEAIFDNSCELPEQPGDPIDPEDPDEGNGDNGDENGNDDEGNGNDNGDNNGDQDNGNGTSGNTDDDENNGGNENDETVDETTDGTETKKDEKKETKKKDTKDKDDDEDDEDETGEPETVAGVSTQLGIGGPFFAPFVGTVEALTIDVPQTDNDEDGLILGIANDEDVSAAGVCVDPKWWWLLFVLQGLIQYVIYMTVKRENVHHRIRFYGAMGGTVAVFAFIFWKFFCPWWDVALALLIGALGLSMLAGKIAALKNPHPIN
jgi:hypothetical protein